MGCTSFLRVAADLREFRIVEFVSRLEREGWYVTPHSGTIFHIDVNAKSRGDWVESPLADGPAVLQELDRRHTFAGVGVNLIRDGKPEHHAMVTIDWTENVMTVMYDDSGPKWETWPRGHDPVWMMAHAQAFIRAGRLRPDSISVHWDSL